MKPVSVVLVLLACFLATAVAYDYRQYYKYEEPKQYRQYYTAYWYYKKGYYPEKPGGYFDYYCRNYYDNYKDWYGNTAKGIYGYSYSFDDTYNPGYKYQDSWGGYATFYSYYDAYNWAYNPEYGFYSGYYNNYYEDGQYDYSKYFKGVVAHKGGDSEHTDFKIVGSNDAPDLKTIF